MVLIPGGVDRLDRGLAHADQLHVGPVEGLKVVGVGADSLGSDRVVVGDEQLGDSRIVDDRANLLFVELAGLVVGLRVDHLVGERLGEQHTAEFPALFERARRSSGVTSMVSFGCAMWGDPPPLRHDSRRRSA